MCRPAYQIQKLSVILACILLTAALLLLESAGTLSPCTYETHRLVRALIDTASALLLIGVVGAVCIEERAL